MGSSFYINMNWDDIAKQGIGVLFAVVVMYGIVELFKVYDATVTEARRTCVEGTKEYLTKIAEKQDLVREQNHVQHNEIKTICKHYDKIIE